jgi:hypothetical protein
MRLLFGNNVVDGDRLEHGNPLQQRGGGRGGGLAAASAGAAGAKP